MAKSTNKAHEYNGDDKQNQNDDNERNDDFSVNHRFGTVDTTAFEATPRQMNFGDGNSPDPGFIYVHRQHSAGINADRKRAGKYQRIIAFS